jgi:hypothetical protein
MGEKPGAQDEAIQERKAAPQPKGASEAQATPGGGSPQPQDATAGAPLKGVDVKLG